MKRVFVPLVLLAAVTLTGTSMPSAGAAEGARHCYVRVIERKASGELVTSEPSCYATMSQMEQASTSPSSQSRSASTQSSILLAIHWDALNRSGGSTSVYGSDCLGGWLNTSAYWAANMASTTNGCGRVRHFYGQNLTGSSDDTVGGGGNLSVTYHHAWSLQYTT